MDSDLGRSESLCYKGTSRCAGDRWRRTETSLFSPVLAEVMTSWYSRPGSIVLDPFAGGVVRGLVCGYLDRRYVGIELRAEQIDANERYVRRCESLIPSRPRYIRGDSMAGIGSSTVDMILTCPPYHDLEIYSDDPRDLSRMTWEGYLDAMRSMVGEISRGLRPDRFFVLVLAERRDRRGQLRGRPSRVEMMIMDTPGIDMYSEIIYRPAIGMAALYASRTMNGGRKVRRVHQTVVIGVSGQWRRAHRYCGAIQ